MKNITKKGIAIAVAIAFTFSLAACTQDNAVSTPTKTAAPTEPTTPAPADTEAPAEVVEMDTEEVAFPVNSESVTLADGQTVTCDMTADGIYADAVIVQFDADGKVLNANNSGCSYFVSDADNETLNDAFGG